MKETNTNTELAPVKVGDKVKLTNRVVFGRIHWNLSMDDIGVVESVRRTASSELQVLVTICGNLWLFPVSWVKKVEVK